MTLFGRGRLSDPEWVTRELAEAYELAASGQQEQARYDYARLAKQLASAPPEMRPYQGLALLGEAEVILAMGNFSDAMSRFRKAYPLLADPVRQLPKWLLRQFAEERMRADDGGLEPLFAFLQAIAWGPEPGDETSAALRTVDWLQQKCVTGPAEDQEATARASIEALPGADWPVLALAAVLRRAGRVTDAETTLAAAALASVARRGSGEIWFRWGIQLSTLGRNTEAVSAFDEALRRGPGESSPWARGTALRSESLLYRGLARQQLGETGMASRDLREAAAVAPHDPRIHYSLGRLAVQLGSDDEAFKHFTAALTIQPGFAPALLGLALLRERAGRPAEAAPHYQAALRLDPTSRPARIRLGAVLLATGRPDEAEALLRPEAAAASYWGKIAAFHHGLVQLRRNDPAGALGTWERLRGADLREWTALARDRVARQQLAADPSAARMLWQHAILDDPTVDEYRIALREAALREAAQLILTGRDRPAIREEAAASLALAASLADADDDEDSHGGEDAKAEVRRNRLRAAIDLAGGSAKDVDRLLDPAAGLRDRCHLAAAALLTGSPEKAVALLAELKPDPDCDPAVARLRALLAEHDENWPEALHWYQRFLGNPVPAVAALARSSGAGRSGSGGAAKSAADAKATTMAVDLHRLTEARLAAGGPDSAALASTTVSAPRARCAAGLDSTGCWEFSTDACDGCGREGCSTHLYRLARTTTLRCGNCAAPVFKAILDCARRAGTPEKAERTLAPWTVVLGDSVIGQSLRRDLALIRAEADDLDGALSRLPVEAVHERVVLHIHRAAVRIGNDEPFRAVEDLREAVELQPGHPEAAAALGALAEYEALLHALEGRQREAFDGYLALLREDPTHPRLLHAVGLTAYRLAGVSEDPDFWRWAIGGLVSSLHLPGLWADVARVTGRPAGPQRMANARRGLLGRLQEDLSKADSILERTGDETDAWAVLLGMEVLACEICCALRDAPVQPDPVQSDGSDGSDGEAAAAAGAAAAQHLIVGPTLDRLLRQQPETAALAKWREFGDDLRRPLAADESDPDRIRAAHVFGTFGAQFYLREEGRHAAAVAGMDSIPEADRDEHWNAFTKQTLIMQGEEHYLNDAWRDAVKCLARAAALYPDEPLARPLVEIAADAGLRAARPLLKAGDEDYPDAIDLMETALTVAPDAPGLRAELGVTHAQQAMKTSEEAADQVLALSHVRRALELAPDDPQARGALGVVLVKRATLLTRPGPDGDLLEAVQRWEELIETKPDPRYRTGLSRAMLLLSRSAALAGHRTLALHRMSGALLADPDWSGDVLPDAPRYIAATLAQYVMTDLDGRPFELRAGVLRMAASYNDAPDLHALMHTVWRREAVERFDARHYAQAAVLLEEALLNSRSAADTAKLHHELGIVYRAEAARLAHLGRFIQSRALTKRALEHSPEDPELNGRRPRIGDDDGGVGGVGGGGEER